MDQFEILDPDGNVLATGGTKKNVYDLVEQFCELGICGVGDRVFINTTDEYIITAPGVCRSVKEVPV